MKKFTKLSLVAAVAVAGLSSANAKPLEEAIKDVEVSGSVVYRYNDYKNDSNFIDPVTGLPVKGSNTTNNYKIGLNLSSKVNDYVKFNSRFIVGEDDSGFVGLDTSSDGDENVANVTLSNAYFGLTAIPNTTINIGKQGLTTPYTTAIDSDGNEQTGTGVLALSTIGSVTAALGYFNQTNLDKSIQGLNAGNIDGSKDIATVAVLGKFGNVNVDAWYLELADTFDTYTVGVNTDVKFDGGKVGFDARYVALSLDKNVAAALGRANKEDNSLIKLVVTGNAGIFNAKIAYAMTDKDGGLTALDNDSKATLLGWNLNANNKADADYWQAVVGVDILDNLNLSANYGNLQYITSATTDVEEEEVYAQLVYKMSKNLSTYVRYGTYTKDTTVSGTKTEKNDDTRGRLQVEYRF